MTHDRNEHDEEEEFWFFTTPSPLPGLDEIKAAMERAYPQFALLSNGSLEQRGEQILTGEIMAKGSDREDTEGMPTAWTTELLDARRHFQHSRGILRDLGKQTKMLRISCSDPYSVGHVLSMLHALLELRGGILSIPSPGDGRAAVFGVREALPMLEDFLEELSLDIDVTGQDE